MPARPASPLTLEYLNRVLATPELMTPGVNVRPLGKHDYAVQVPGMKSAIRVTTDPKYYDLHAETVEFWSPGGLLFERVRP